MSDVLSFYFDGAIVQAVQVRITGNSVTINDARTFPFDELDDYLTLCSEKTCIVCSNPQLFYQDILHLPPAAAKHYDTLVRSEIQNAHPDLTSFSIFHHTIGESTIDSRPYSKIAAFSYPDGFLDEFILAVNRHRIAIAALYSAPGSIFRLALSTCSKDTFQSRMFIASLPGEKLLLVGENKELAFIRKIPSLEGGLLPEETNSINMTVDYCFQTLRVRPIEAVMLNQSELPEELSPLISIPYRAALPPQLADIPPHFLQDYLAPIAAALQSSDSPGIGNIRPAEYAVFSAHKKILTAATIFLLVLTLVAAGDLVAELMIISGLKSDINRVRTELSGAGSEIASFRKLDAEVTAFKQPLDFINRHNTALNPATALAALTLPTATRLSIKGITVQSEEGYLAVRIEGTISAASFSETQAIFEELVDHVGKIPGYLISADNVDVKLKTFTIQARYNGIGKPGK